MTFEIDIFFPTAHPGAAAQTEPLGSCKVLTHPLFLTVTEHNGEAHLVPLEEVTELDRRQIHYTTIFGRTHYPRRVDLPDKIYVETATGHARTIEGDLIARIARGKGETPGKGVRW